MDRLDDLSEHESRVMSARTRESGTLGVIGNVALRDGRVLHDVPLVYRVEDSKLSLAEGTAEFAERRDRVSFSRDQIQEIRISEGDQVKFRPSVLQIETTTRCNLQCVFCVGRDFQQQRLSLDDYRTVIGRFDYELDEVILQGEGEPFLYEDIFEMIRLARGKAKKVSSISNGHLLHRVGDRIVQSGLDELGFSLESIQPDQFASLRRGGNFEIFDRNVRDFHSRKGSTNPATVLYVSVLRETLREIPEILAWADSAGFPVVKLQPLQAKDSYHSHYDDRLKRNEISYGELWRHMQRFRTRYDDTILRGFFDKRDKDSVVCSMIPNWLYVLVNGDVTPCCFIKQDRKETGFGNLIRQPLEEVLRSETVQAFRKRLFSGRIPVDCEGCNLSEPDARNWRKLPMT